MYTVTVCTIGYYSDIVREGTNKSHNSLVALRKLVMTVNKTHPGLCIKYSRWDILCEKMDLQLANQIVEFLF